MKKKSIKTWVEYDIRFTDKTAPDLAALIEKKEFARAARIGAKQLAAVRGPRRKRGYWYDPYRAKVLRMAVSKAVEFLKEKRPGSSEDTLRRDINRIRAAAKKTAFKT